MPIYACRPEAPRREAKRPRSDLGRAPRRKEAIACSLAIALALVLGCHGTNGIVEPEPAPAIEGVFSTDGPRILDLGYEIMVQHDLTLHVDGSCWASLTLHSYDPPEGDWLIGETTACEFEVAGGRIHVLGVYAGRTSQGEFSQEIATDYDVVGDYESLVFHLCRGRDGVTMIRRT
jgi:hypothetical protein